MNSPENSQLGKASAYIDHYDASLLFPIARAGKRAEIGLAAQMKSAGSQRRAQREADEKAEG